MNGINKMNIRFLTTVFLLLQAMITSGQPGPNWAGILNFNKDLMSKNGVSESMSVAIEGDEAKGLFRDVFRADGLMDTAYDYSFIAVDNKVRIFVSCAVFDFYEDSVRVRGFQGDQFVAEVDSIELHRWTDYFALLPKVWNQNFAFMYGRDASGFYRYEGERTYNEAGKLSKITKLHNNEPVWEKVYFYEGDKLIREDRYKKSYYEGYIKELEVYYTYTAAGLPDSSYTRELIDFGGKDDTTIAGVVRKHYDKKNRLTVETTIEDGHVRSVTNYQYDINENKDFKAEMRDARNYLLEERIYSSGGLELNKKAFDKVYGLIGESINQYRYFEQ